MTNLGSNEEFKVRLFKLHVLRMLKKRLENLVSWKQTLPKWSMIARNNILIKKKTKEIFNQLMNKGKSTSFETIKYFFLLIKLMGKGTPNGMIYGHMTVTVILSLRIKYKRY